MTHRQIIKEWLGSIKLSNQFVIDWGSGSKPVSRYIQHENCKFITIDQNTLIAGDRRALKHYVWDIQEPIVLGESDIAFCIEVLEHVQDFDKVIKNIWANLKQGGKLYLSAPFKYEIHADEDYWRFTKHGLILLLERHGFKVDSINETVAELGYIVEAHK